MLDSALITPVGLSAATVKPSRYSEDIFLPAGIPINGHAFLSSMVQQKGVFCVALPSFIHVLVLLLDVQLAICSKLDKNFACWM